MSIDVILGAPGSTNITSVALQGTALDDTFNFIGPSQADVPLFNVTGSISGGAGTDTLAVSRPAGVTYLIDFSSINPVNLTSIERLDLSNANAGPIHFSQSQVDAASDALSSTLAVTGNNATNQEISISASSGAISLEGRTFFNWQSNIHLLGSPSDNTITGSSRNDTIESRDGNDTIIGSNGTDTIDGGAGNDRSTCS